MSTLGTTPVGRRRLVIEETANSCFFRSAASDGMRKALLQITERCNLHCAHCFVSATRHGRDMSLDAISDRVLPQLIDAKVSRVTLTGGEPFVHPDLLEIVRLSRKAELRVSICTNATCITEEQIEALLELGDVHVNVSFDGFRPESHGRFRGDVASFDTTVETTRKLAAAGLLQGLLSTPNALTSVEDYRALTRFSIAVGAEYVLMNPLSSFGRGIKSRRRLGASITEMRAILAAAQEVADEADVEIVPIRFPNDAKPLGGCTAGDIIYVFASGEVAVCPYLVFAARSPGSLHSDDEFLVGNIFENDIADALNNYAFHDRYRVGANATCEGCAAESACGKGCPAAVIAAGERIGARDVEVCPLP